MTLAGFMKKISTICIFCIIFFSCDNSLTPAKPIINKGIADKRDVGQSAHDLLSAVKYTRLNIEIQFAPGMRPHDHSVNNLVSFFKNYVYKPAGVTVTLKQVGSIAKAKITTQDADSFALKNRILYTEGNLVSLYIYFADAASTRFWIGGIAYRNTAMVVFEKTILENTKGAGEADRIKMETGVIEHEAGHLLGLVNNGTAMQIPHEDPSHKFHCSNRNCLMYYAIEAGMVRNPDNSLPVLDANCVRDLKAYKVVE